METNEIVAPTSPSTSRLSRACWRSATGRSRTLQASSDSRAKYLSFLSRTTWRGGLNGTLLMIEVLRRELKPHVQFAEAMEDLEAERAARSSTPLAHGSLPSRREARNGKLQPRLGPVNLRTLVSDVVNQLSWTAKEKGRDDRIAIRQRW